MSSATPIHRLAWLAPLALLLVPADAGAVYRNLCTSVPGVCTFVGPGAPVLDANVCFSSTGGVVLMGGSGCPSGSWAYHVDYGEVVDPMSGAVAAYVPLDDACDHPGLCVEAPPPPGAQEFPMCCNSNGTCYDGASCGGTLWWCNDGVCNEDGTITCFDKDPG